MPQLQSIVLTDRTPTTPVNLTFVPRDITNGVGMVVNAAGVPIGEKKLSVSLKRVGSRYKSELRLVLPVVVNETINGVTRPVVVRTAFVTVQATFDETSTKQERDDAIGMIASALGTGKVLVNDTVVNLENVY